MIDYAIAVCTCVYVWQLYEPELLCEHVELLLKVIRDVTKTDDTHLRAKACLCLTDMETAYPVGIQDNK